MHYLIVKTYGQQGGEYFQAAAGSDRPAAYPTLEVLAANLKAERQRQELWKAGDPKTRGMAGLTPVAAERVPDKLRTAFAGRPATRPLNDAERRRLAQLTPGLK